MFYYKAEDTKKLHRFSNSSPVNMAMKELYPEEMLLSSDRLWILGMAFLLV